MISSLSLTLAVSGIVFALLTSTGRVPASLRGSVVDLIPGVAGVLIPTIGAVIVSRQHRNIVGWAFVVAGLAAGVAFAARGYARYAAFVAPDLRGEAIAGWLADLGDASTFAIMGPVLLLLFPDGKPLSRRWRPIVAFAFVSVTAMLLVTALSPGPLENLPARDNPFGVAALAAFVEPVDQPVGITMLAGVVAIILRFRRSRGTERQQLKWLMFVVVVGAASVPIWIVTAGDNAAGIAIGMTLFVGIPVAAGLAVLRYRLYDIDRIVSRTVTYAIVAGALSATYLGCVVVLQQVLAPRAGGSDLAVAMSTLAVVALFVPLRRRVRQVVDRRFNRSTYDATRIVDAFTARLREQTDIDSLATHLNDVVRQTVQPQHVSLWTANVSRRRRPG